MKDKQWVKNTRPKHGREMVAVPPEVGQGRVKNEETEKNFFIDPKNI
jgi:hypothetical protein